MVIWREDPEDGWSTLAVEGEELPILVKLPKTTSGTNGELETGGELPAQVIAGFGTLDFAITVKESLWLWYHVSLWKENYFSTSLD